MLVSHAALSPDVGLCHGSVVIGCRWVMELVVGRAVEIPV